MNTPSTCAAAPLALAILDLDASAGIASTAEPGDVGTHVLYKAADDALYRAKAEGRNRTVVATRKDESGNP